MSSLNSLRGLKSFSASRQITNLLMEAYPALISTLKEEYRDQAKYNEEVINYLDNLNLESMYTTIDKSGVDAEEYCKKHATKLVSGFINECKMFKAINNPTLMFLEDQGGYLVLR